LTESEPEDAVFGFNQAGGQRFKEIDNDIELFPYLNDDDDSLSEHDIHLQQANLEINSALDLDDIALKARRRRSRFAEEDSQASEEPRNNQAR